MNVQEQIKKYIDSQPEPKRSDMRELTVQVLIKLKVKNQGRSSSKINKFSNLKVCIAPNWVTIEVRTLNQYPENW
jgi:hypothetical protein